MKPDKIPEITMVIRPMEKKDIDIVVSLESRIFSDPWPARAFIDGLRDNSHHFLVVEVDDSVVGYASYYIDMGEGRLTNIAVTPEFRRKNIAKKLLECILSIVVKAECKYIFLDVRPTNGAAISLYSKFGFYEVYRRPDYYLNPPEEAMVMVKDLTGE